MPQAGLCREKHERIVGSVLATDFFGIVLWKQKLDRRNFTGSYVAELLSLEHIERSPLKADAV